MSMRSILMSTVAVLTLTFPYSVFSETVTNFYVRPQAPMSAPPPAATGSGDTNAPPITPTTTSLSVLVGSFPLSAFIGDSVSFPVSISGGIPPYNISPVMPNGFTFSNNVISGVVSAAGTYNFDITVTDSAAQPNTSKFQNSFSSAAAGINIALNKLHYRAGETISGTISSTNLSNPSWQLLSGNYSLSNLVFTANGFTAKAIAGETYAQDNIIIGSNGVQSNSSAIMITPPLKITGSVPPTYNFEPKESVSLSFPAFSNTIGQALYQFRDSEGGKDSVCGLSMNATTGVVSGSMDMTCNKTDLLYEIIDTGDQTRANSASFSLVAKTPIIAALPKTQYRAGESVTGSISNSSFVNNWTLNDSNSLFSSFSLSNGQYSATISNVTTSKTGSYSLSSNGFTTNSNNLTIVPSLSIDDSLQSSYTFGPGNNVSIQGVTASNIIGSLSYSLLQNGNPASALCGLGFNSSSGLLSGTISSNCLLSNLTIKATDSYDNASKVSKAFSITSIAPPTLTLAKTTLRGGTTLSGTINNKGAASSWTVASTSTSTAFQGNSVSYSSSDGNFSIGAASVSTPVSGTIQLTSNTGQVTDAVTVNVVPPFAFNGAYQTAYGYGVGDAVTINPMPVKYNIGNLVYTLYDGGTQVNSVCGLSFNSTTGVLSGNITTCSKNIRLFIKDDYDNTMLYSSYINLSSGYFGMLQLSLNDVNAIMTARSTGDLYGSFSSGSQSTQTWGSIKTNTLFGGLIGSPNFAGVAWPNDATNVSITTSGNKTRYWFPYYSGVGEIVTAKDGAGKEFLLAYLESSSATSFNLMDNVYDANAKFVKRNTYSYNKDSSYSLTISIYSNSQVQTDYSPMVGRSKILSYYSISSSSCYTSMSGNPASKTSCIANSVGSENDTSAYGWMMFYPK